MRSTVFSSAGHTLAKRQTKIPHVLTSIHNSLQHLRPAPPRPMGAEGSPLKSSSLFTPSREKMESEVSSPDTPPDGRRRALRKGAGLAEAQTTCIRQILLLQLELIEQQQKQLHSKSREIHQLRTEKDMLMERIERMERRLQTGRRDGGDACSSHTPRHKDPDTQRSSADHTPSHAAQHAQTSADTRYRRDKNQRRRFLFQDSPSPQEEAEQDLPYMTTTEMYLSRWPEPPPEPWPDSSPPHQEMVSVPSWRENVLEPLDRMEASDVHECLDDQTFLKRHAKFELDEKRRKRWDVQRIREQRMFQRLQQRMNRSKMTRESEPEVLSFYPDPEDVESIMVTPFLPVVAFGRPIPNMKPRDFELPWLDEVSKKRTPHRTCRK